MKKRKGTTLIELIVTFALVSLFVTLSSQVISSCLNLYYQIQGVNFGRQVSDTIMEKVESEICGAFVSPPDTKQLDEGQVCTLMIADDKNKIDLFDKTGSRIYITSNATDGLIIYYYEVTKLVESGEIVRYEAVNWKFAENMYLGYAVTELKFSRPYDDNPSSYRQNIIKVDLTIKGKYGEYKSQRYIECYNFQTSSDFDKIKSPGLGGGGGTPPNIGMNGSTNEDNTPNEETASDFEKAVGEFFSKGWSTWTYGDTEVSYTVQNGILVIYSYTNKDKLSNSDIDEIVKQIGNKEEISFVNDKVNKGGTVLNINDSKIGGTNEGTLLIKLLGYEDSVDSVTVFLDKKNNNRLMAIKYNQNGTNIWCYYNGYNKKKLEDEFGDAAK